MLEGIKVLGAFLGDDTWCERQLVKRVERALEPLKGITQLATAHGTAGGGGGAGTYSEPDTDEESEEESEWEEEGEHGAWEDGPPRAAAPERDK